MFYSGTNHRAYGPKTAHAETTLQFVPPEEYKRKRRAHTTSLLTDREANKGNSRLVGSFVPLPPRVQTHIERDRELVQQKQRLSPVVSSQTILPMKIIEEPLKITA